MNEGLRERRVVPQPSKVSVTDSIIMGNRYWLNSQPMPMVGRPCTCTESMLTEQLARMLTSRDVWCWTEAVDDVPDSMNWLRSDADAHPASVEPELSTWAQTNPDSWLVVDGRGGKIPDAGGQLEEILRSLPVNVIMIIEDDTIRSTHPFPPWEYPL